MKRLRLAPLLLVLLASVSWLGCSRRPPTATQPEPSPPTVATDIRFEDVTAAAGVKFVHFDTSTPMHYILETMGSGAGWIDFDNDGNLDLYCVQACPVLPDTGKPQPTARFYRNNGNGTFSDVTEQVGLAESGFGMGCAVGDFDNDTFDDLAVAYFGEVRLYHNQPHEKGGRRFVNVTEKARLKNPHWGTSCAWGDIDNDGFLDLFVCNYVEVDLKNYKPCVDPKIKENFVCHPRLFPGAKNRLFRNNGKGTFTDVSESSGIAAAAPATGLAVALVDLDGDGKQDIYVANDMKPAYLFHNQGEGKFLEKGILSGSALQSGGRYMAGMGVAVGDVDGSRRPSLFVTNYQREPNNLFLNRGKLTFGDGTHSSGLGPASTSFLAFGTVMVDANLDGLPDVAVANGHVLRNSQPIENAPYEQTAQLFQGLGKARFRDVSSGVGPYFHRKLVGRGLACADYNNDGRPDLVFTHNAGPLVLLKNTGTTGRSLCLELIGDPAKKSNRNAIGAVVEVECGEQRQTQWVIGGGSYLSASDRRVFVGLGKADKAEKVRVTWPSGGKKEYADLKAGEWYRLKEGQEVAEQVTRKK